MSEATPQHRDWNRLLPWIALLITVFTAVWQQGRTAAMQEAFNVATEAADKSSVERNDRQEAEIQRLRETVLWLCIQRSRDDREANRSDTGTCPTP